MAGRLSEDPERASPCSRAATTASTGWCGRRWPGAIGARQNPPAGPMTPCRRRARRPHRLPAAQQDAQQLLRHQRHGLYPRPSSGTTTTGLRSEIPAGPRRRAALFPQVGKQRDARRRIPRQGRAAECRRTHTGNPLQETFLDAARECQMPMTSDFNGARSRRLRNLPGHADQRRTMQRARAYIHPHRQAPEPVPCRPARRCFASFRRQARGRRRIPGRIRKKVCAPAR